MKGPVNHRHLPVRDVLSLSTTTSSKLLQNTATAGLEYMRVRSPSRPLLKTRARAQLGATL